MLRTLDTIFLYGRTHATRIDDAVSDISELISGVVQGSSIGPVMFLAYFNELIYILEQFGIKVKMFADVVKMYVQTVNNVDMERLQNALSALYDWAKEWQLEISVDKCCVMNIGAENCTPYLTLNNSVLPVAPNIRDFGVIVNNDLSVTSHVTDVVSKAHRRAKLAYSTNFYLARYQFTCPCFYHICTPVTRVQHCNLVAPYSS